MDTRILGLKSAYSVVLSVDAEQRLSPGEAVLRLFGPSASGGPAADVALRNGGRLGLSADSRPAYTTPDCSSVPDLVV